MLPTFPVAGAFADVAVVVWVDAELEALVVAAEFICDASGLLPHPEITRVAHMTHAAAVGVRLIIRYQPLDLSCIAVVGRRPGSSSRAW